MSKITKNKVIVFFIDIFILGLIWLCVYGSNPALDWYIQALITYILFEMMTAGRLIMWLYDKFVLRIGKDDARN